MFEIEIELDLAGVAKKQIVCENARVVGCTFDRSHMLHLIMACGVVQDPRSVNARHNPMSP